LQDEQGFQDELQPFSLSLNLNPQLSTSLALNPQPTTLNNMAPNAGNFHQAIEPPVGRTACRVR
jgi:hypothetical protein